MAARQRYSTTSPGQVTGYAVGPPGHNGPGGEPLWYGGGRLSAALTLPRLRRRRDPAQNNAPDQSSAAERCGVFGCTGPERDAIYRHAARRAAAAADHIRQVRAR